MGRRHRRNRRKNKVLRACLSICAVVLVMAVVLFAVQNLEDRLNPKVENAGKQMTTHTTEDTAHVFMDGHWYKKKNVETLLMIGIDDFDIISGGESYNNTNQADFMALFVRDTDTGMCTVVHLNRDTMTDITMLGVTGDNVGTRNAQIALAFNYGRGQHDSSMNTVNAVSHLLYGTDIDHYMTLTMDAVPIINDWAGGVTVEVREDMTSADSSLVVGEEIKLMGEQALAYVRTRKGLDDSTNINRMERQRQYASAWATAARDKLADTDAVIDLVLQMSDYHYSDCTAEELSEMAAAWTRDNYIDVVEIPGEAVMGEQYMEFHADDEQIQQLVLQLFYERVS